MPLSSSEDESRVMKKEEEEPVKVAPLDENDDNIPESLGPTLAPEVLNVDTFLTSASTSSSPLAGAEAATVSATAATTTGSPRFHEEEAEAHLLAALESARRQRQVPPGGEIPRSEEAPSLLTSINNSSFAGSLLGKQHNVPRQENIISATQAMAITMELYNQGAPAANVNGSADDPEHVAADEDPMDDNRGGANGHQSSFGGIGSTQHPNDASMSHQSSHYSADRLEVLDAADRIMMAAPILRRAALVPLFPKLGQRRKHASSSTAGGFMSSDLVAMPPSSLHSRSPEMAEEGVDPSSHASSDQEAPHGRYSTYFAQIQGAWRALPAQGQRHAKNSWTATVQEYKSMQDFFRPKRATLRQEITLFLVLLILPALATATILFYGVDNPPTGRCEGGVTPPGTPVPFIEGDDTVVVDSSCGYRNSEPIASVSWWVLFLGVRHVLVFLLARATDVFVIDYIVLQHPRVVRLLGPRVSLVILQSKGWPSILFWWAVWASAFLYGEGAFPNHWLFFQDGIAMFNKENPSGEVTTSAWFRGCLITAAVVGACVALKRYWIGLYLGRRLYTRFNDRLLDTMHKVLLVSELALWTRRTRDERITFKDWMSSAEGGAGAKNEHLNKSSTSGHFTESRAKSWAAKRPVPEPEPSHRVYSKKESGSKEKEKNKRVEALEQQMDQWLEPRKKNRNGQEVSGSNIIEFRQTFAVMTRPYVFTSAFGPVDSRHECIESSDRVFRRLLKLMNVNDDSGGHETEGGNQDPGARELDGTDRTIENEETTTSDPSISLHDLTRWMYGGCHHPEEIQQALTMIDLLNPDHQGRMNAIGFSKAIDAVYKEVRLLENAVDNASDIDKGYERVINIFFYLILGTVCLTILGLDVLTLVLSLSSLIVAFSFMIGPASAQYFEGILMVLARQPYDIGDRIAVSDVDEPPNMDGSVHWLVESIDLVTTTARLTATNEEASFSNGALARMRIINMNRSPDSIVYVPVRFSMSVPYATILIFRSTVQRFVEDRPQEWQSIRGFRTTRVEAQMNYVEYSIVLMHRLSWQSLIPVLESKAAVASFCVESQKQLGCHYTAPSMPVEIRMAGNKNDYATNAPEEGGEPSLMPVMETEETEPPVQKLMEDAKLFESKKAV